VVIRYSTCKVINFSIGHGKMKVLVTGGCGFLGSHVCEFYAAKGAQVVAYDNMTKHELERTGLASEEARDFNWNFLKYFGVKLVKADVRNYE